MENYLYSMGEINPERATKEENIIIDDDIDGSLFIKINLCRLTDQEKAEYKNDPDVKLYLNSFENGYIITVKIGNVFTGDGGFILGEPFDLEPPKFTDGAGRLVCIVVIDTYNGETVYIRSFTASTRFSNALIKAKEKLNDNFISPFAANEILKSICNRHSTKELIKLSNMYTTAGREN